MKVADLEGVRLDYWVAKANGWIDYPADSMEHGRYWHTDPLRAPFGERREKRYFTPSTDWSQGGPIMERELIEPHTRSDAGLGRHWGACLTKDCETDWHSMQRGSTILIAAMRVYVESKFGDEVPDTDGA